MALFTWNETYSVKVAQCDEQHRKLFAMINELADAMRMGQGQEVVNKTVGELLQYTRTHFEQEEQLMEKAGYPHLSAHQALHRKFVAEVEAVQKEMQAGRQANSVKVLNMLRDWLVNHIQKTDKQYSAHLNAAGIH
jgi:hemerythrin